MDIRDYQYRKSGEEKLIAPMKEDNGEIKYYVCYDDLLTILEETHVAVGNGGKTRMLKECNCRYKNITVKAIMTYKAMLTLSKETEDIEKRQCHQAVYFTAK
ncbi:hypothetical protein ACJJTC_000990 [Scirpophaga incertulas]